MNIDPAQIVTHVIGFLLAVWLMKRYAWKGVLGIVEKRRATIEQSFEDIERGQEAVEEQKQHYAREIENIETTRRQKIQEAAQKAEELAATIKDEAHQDANSTREKAKQDVELELDKANEILKARMIDAVLTTTEKVIHERLDRDKHTQLIEMFLAELKVK